jgi:hypothetical protein
MDTASGVDSNNTTTATLRVRPIGGSYFLCRAVNHSQKTIKFRDADILFHNGNGFEYHQLSRAERFSSFLGALTESPDEPPSLVIAPGKMYRREVGREDEGAWKREFPGQYVALNWYMDSLRSPTIYVGFTDEAGKIALPVVEDKDASVRAILAFVYQDKKAPELSFLILNGTKTSVVMTEPLVQKSTIRASAPAIQYTRELVLPKAEAKMTKVEPGKVAEWRLPWQTVLDLIPKEDLAKIEAAGGDLDLVWKVGEFESPILPLSLGRPDEGK